MAHKQQYECDICGVAKQDSNHWLLAYHIGEETGIVFMTWSDNPNPAYVNHLHLCGQGCAAKLLSITAEGWNK